MVNVIDIAKIIIKIADKTKREKNLKSNYI